MICNQHKEAKEWRQVTFEYNEDGITVRVPGIYAWVCPVDEEASFTPETFDELLTTVRELLEPAKRAQARRSMLRSTAFLFRPLSNFALRLDCLRAISN